jgi:hypothetical protein
MKNRRFVLLVTILAVGALSGNCKKASINPNDSTKPTVSIKVRDKDGQFKEMNNTTLKVDGSESLKFACTAEDPEGVKSARYSYSGNIPQCAVGSTISNGSFHIVPLPAPVEQVLSGDANSEVLTKLPLFSNPDLKGPFHCTVGTNEDGSPRGQNIIVSCHGTNWSSNNQNNSATKTLTVTLN